MNMVADQTNKKTNKSCKTCKLLNIHGAHADIYVDAKDQLHKHLYNEIQLPQETYFTISEYDAHSYTQWS